MEDEIKTILFKEMLKLEHLSEVETFDGHDYAEQSYGAFQMLSALGLGNEYISWAFGKQIP